MAENTKLSITRSFFVICKVINNLRDYIIISGLSHCVWDTDWTIFQLLIVFLTTMSQILTGSNKR